MPFAAPGSRLEAMNEMQSSLERVEARLDRQSARIDALYRTLEERGIIPGPRDVGARDAFFDELIQLEEAPPAHARRAAPRRRRATGLRVGASTGV
jgi:hypothetical protein